MGTVIVEPSGEQQASSPTRSDTDVLMAIGPNAELRTVEEAMVVATKRVLGINFRRSLGEEEEEEQRELSPLGRSTSTTVTVSSLGVRDCALVSDRGAAV